ncbi:MAG: carboxypeptidase-like regulatory domain-containing protein [Rikenellaceae bacterium]
MRRYILILICLFTIVDLSAQQRWAVGGVVCNSEREAVVGAVVTIKELSNRGEITNAKGEYALALESGRYTFVVTAVGYRTANLEVDVNSDRVVDVVLTADDIRIRQVDISATSSRAKLESVQIGVEAVSIETISMTPALFGENDIIKSIVLLPGVKSEGDGSTGFQVRGGTSSQNLILLDDVPIYNSGHVLGIFSVFNDDAIASADLYKGQIPATFGGASSSILDIQSKGGDMHDFSAGVDVGVLSAKVQVDVPIVEDKLSFFGSMRRSYFDLFLRMTNDFSGNSMHFYDINGKLSYKINEDNILSLSYFRGEDKMGLEDMMDMSWGNNSVALRYFHRYNSALNSTTSLINSDYGTDNGIDIADIYLSFDGYIKNKGLKHNFTYQPNERHTLQVGLQSTFVDLQSAEWQYNDALMSEQRYGLESAVWVNEQWRISPLVDLSVGLRLNNFLALGGSPYYTLDESGAIETTTNYAKGEVVANYLQLEPRASVNFHLTDFQSIKTGYSRSSQNIHALRSSSMSLPFDRYAMSSNLVEPQVSDQFALGVISLTRDQAYEFSVEGYYKSIDNVYDYRDGTAFNTAIELETLLLGGEGRAYGVEMSAKRNLGKLTGWVAYTLSWVDSRIEGINGGEWYTASNDRRHDLSVVAMWQINDAWHASANFVYNTGQALTAPSAKYEIEGDTYYYYAERNGYRAPSYHRLDVSFTHSKRRRRTIREWNFGFYNIYNHYNPYMIYFEDDAQEPSGTTTIQYSLYGIIPSVTYGIKF